MIQMKIGEIWTIKSNDCKSIFYNQNHEKMILNISNGFRKFFYNQNERFKPSIKYDQKKKIIKTTIYNDATIAGIM